MTAAVTDRARRCLFGVRQSRWEAHDVRCGERNARVFSGAADQKQAGNAFFRNRRTGVRRCAGSSGESHWRRGSSIALYGM